ncbi:biotin holocarboxylase synthetase, variant 2 [Arthrobotrys megalospora]
MNVLVYSGPGASVEAVRQCTDTLRRLLTPHYAVAPISAEALVKEPWAPTCALLCMPGGADLGYCKALNGTGTRVLKQYVRRGGKFLGFCAGAYFASANIEFEKGDLSLEVTGTRELGFFPGLCRGAAFKGFKYNSEAGARFCELAVTSKLLDMGAPDIFRSYYNGGGVFVDADRLTDQGIDVLARYREELDVGTGGGNAAAVGCQVGAGYALLVGTHPEFATGKLGKSPYGRQEQNQFQGGRELDEARRLMFMSALFRLLGLKSNDDMELVPSSSTLHLSGLNPGEVTRLLGGLKDVRSPGTDGPASMVIEAEAATFLLEGRQITPSTSIPDDRTDGDSIVRVKIYENSIPTDGETPNFSVLTYFQRLRNYHSQPGNKFNFGSPLLYGELMTSTNSILDR